MAGALLVSLVLHAATLLVITHAPLVRASAAERLNESPPEASQERWRLGIDQPAPTTAVAWIGYDTYRAMNAPQSDIDQAGLTRAAPTPAPDQPPTDPQAAQVAQVTREARQAMSTATARLLELARSVAGALALPLSGTRALDEPVAQQETPLAEAAAPTQQLAPEPIAAAPEPGTLAETEADPTTTLPAIEADDLGQPLAAQGIVIETVRPRFSHYMQLTANPTDPLVRIHFDRGGSVRWVELAESTGYQAIDEPIRAAVYRWRASGEAFQAFVAEKPDQVLIVSLRILL